MTTTTPTRGWLIGRLSRLGLSARILAGLGLGVLVGLFFGEGAAVLQPLADVYIRLMQMTVLPYLVIALVVGFGQLESGHARRLALRAGAMLLVTWVLACGAVAALPLTFPRVESASFFSHALVEPRQPFSIPDLFFTANPFHSLSNAVVPAVVLFSSLIGIGLIGLPERERLLGPLRVLNTAVTAVTLLVVRLTPVGVFALGAVAAGTLSPETLQRLEVYLVAFAAAALLLTFVLLPLLVTAVTPFRYREVVGIAQDALLTAFVANNAFIVLPILVERSKELMARHGLLSPDADSAADLLVPILFNFPNAGRLLTLLFVPFAGWLAGSPLPAGRYPALFAVGVPSYFAKAQVALPFLMDVFGLPHDLFDLYLPTTILSGKFDSMVTAMNLLVFALLGGAAMGGFVELRRRRLLTAGATMAAGTLATVLAVRLLLGASVDTGYHRDEALRRMHAPRGAVAVLLRDREALRREPAPGGATVLERVRARGALRVGCDLTNAPFSFVNAEGQLVGLDVELAQQLGEALGVRAEFVPVGWHEVPQVLAEGLIDTMPSLWYRPFWFPSVRLTTPYLTGTVGLVVPDARRDEFARIEDLRRSRGLRIGVPLDRSQLDVSVKRYFGEAQVDIVPLDGASTFLEGRAPDLDAFLMPAESASAATLLYPQFSVVVPQPNPVRIPMAFGVAPEAIDLADAIDEWVVFATSVDSPRLAYDYWILGQGARDEKPRWSILRDVLGWQGPPERR